MRWVTLMHPPLLLLLLPLPLLPLLSYARNAGALLAASVKRTTTTAPKLAFVIFPAIELGEEEGLEQGPQGQPCVLLFDEMIA